MATAAYCIGTFLVILSLLMKTGHSIQCYQCTSISNEDPFQCNEFLTSDVDLQPKSCDDVYGARYCVKHVGRFEDLFAVPEQCLHMSITLDCYQCASEDEWKCMDSGLVESALVPTNCSHVYDARYCVKSIGRFGGGIGTKRFCSAVDMGNYCDYVKQPGDKLTYRTCVYTCTGHGCNLATSSMPSATHTWIIPISLLVVWRLMLQIEDS